MLHFVALGPEESLIGEETFALVEGVQNYAVVARVGVVHVQTGGANYLYHGRAALCPVYPVEGLHGGQK